MEGQKSYFPLKLLFAYLTIAALVIAVTVMLFSENVKFSKTEKKIVSENAKILTINAFFSRVHETENLSRITIHSGTQADYNRYIAHSDSLNAEIDSLKMLVSSQYQVQLLDSLKLLLGKKRFNIVQLREIKQRSGNDAGVTDAINRLANMESSLRKLRIEDFVKNPAQLKGYQRKVLSDYVEYLNQNIPDDETNTLSQKVLDSMLTASRVILNEVRRENGRQKNLLNNEEKKLLDNEMLISTQLRNIVTEIESEIVDNNTKNNRETTQALNKIIRIVTSAAVVGLALALIFSLLILNDFLKNKRYKKELERANERARSLLKSREQLISTVSHDLKTPLSTISGYTELLGNANLEKKLQYYNSNIKVASQYISHLVQDLLDFTQIEAGKITIESIPYSLHDVINEVALSIQSVHQAKAIELIITTDIAFSKLIIGDPFRLRQILTNLIGNAYKFTSEGKIEISAKPDVDRNILKITIADSGIGIAEEKQLLIFDEFTQADETVEKRFGGTGLGLTISKRMTELLGGTLDVKSSVGKGSVFTIVLPLQFDPNAKEIAPSAKIVTVAVIDDDINLLNLTTEILKREQHMVLPFSNAREALISLESITFDVILTDIQMPEMNGFEFIEELKATNWYPEKKQPLIAITGQSDAGEIYASAGFATVIRKPYMPKLLIETILCVVNNEAVGSTEPASLTGSPIALLKEFFPDDDEAVHVVLKTFYHDATKNIAELEKAIQSGNTDQMRQISHKMSPMFYQLGASDVSVLLKDLELKELTKQEMLQIFDKLEPKVHTLLLEINRKLVL